jgi:hypothetical protein
MEYTIREAADIRGVSTKTIRRQILAGEVKAELIFNKLLRSTIYLIPKTEIQKIKVRPAHRPKSVQP